MFCLCFAFLFFLVFEKSCLELESRWGKGKLFILGEWSLVIGRKFSSLFFFFFFFFFLAYRMIF